MDGRTNAAKPATSLAGGAVALLMLVSPALAHEPKDWAAGPCEVVRTRASQLWQATGERVQEWREDIARRTLVLAVTMIGGHWTTTDPGTPKSPPPPPPPPPGGTGTGGKNPPPPPPGGQGNPPPPPPPPPPPSQSPEPATVGTALLGAGIASVVGWMRRRRKQTAETPAAGE